RYDFLRWVEDAQRRPVSERYEALSTGISRTWGQLQLTATLAEDGKRRYAIRHVEDADREELDSYDDPLSARELVKQDDDGRYRPLST
ncbi:DR2241 family protein, partial [Aeromonas diversa]|uniref:DR2241 family protein n=1 Tax=Aeromonas diversa TaxID=502790 RepID=UPI0039A1DF0D